MLHDIARVRALLAAGLACAIGLPGALAAETATTKGSSTTTSTTKSAAKATGTGPREGAFGKGTSTQPILTRDQLRQCLSEQDRIKQEGAELARQQAQIEKDRSEIERMGTELEAGKASLDASDEAAVTAYNERVRKRAKMIEDFKAAAPVFNARVDKLVVDRKAYADACADRRFFEEDYDDIKAGK
jgi:hypothetical protein